MLYLIPEPELEEGAGALVVETYVKQLIREGQVGVSFALMDCNEANPTCLYVCAAAVCGFLRRQAL